MIVCGVLVAIETLRALKSTPYDLYFVFTTQEEVGVRGATTSAYGVDPDMGIALDVTPTGDTPHALRMEMALGKGPCIKIQDVGHDRRSAGGAMDDPRRGEK